MHIRKSEIKDLPAILEIYESSRKFMRVRGNPTQWSDEYPSQSIVEGDVARGVGFVCVDGEQILAAFYFAVESDASYARIDGAWLDDSEYGVIHRLARAKNGKKAAEFCIDWCLAKAGNIRIDTHKNNKPMLSLLERLGFDYCGIIRLVDTDFDNERLAFQKRLR